MIKLFSKGDGSVPKMPNPPPPYEPKPFKMLTASEARDLIVDTAEYRENVKKTMDAECLNIIGNAIYSHCLDGLKSLDIKDVFHGNKSDGITLENLENAIKKLKALGYEIEKKDERNYIIQW